MKALSILSLVLLASCGEQVQVRLPDTIDGKDGQSCYSETVIDGVNIVCGDSTSFIPNPKDGIDGDNGQDGVNGQDGLDGSFDGYIEYVEVCPDVNANNSHIETLLYLDGQYMAFLASNQWNKQRLVVLDEGVLYQTTDDRNVQFSIINGELTCIE